MGMIYRPKYRRPDGTVAESQVFWMKYYVNGVPVRESTKTTKERAALHKLRLREGDAARGEPVQPKINRMKMNELLDAVVQDYRMNGKRSLGDLERRIERHLVPFFKAATNAAGVTDADVRRFIVQRQEAGATNGEINRELAVLRRGYRLARKVVTVRPDITMLAEPAPRAGFFERDQFAAVHAHLPAALQPVIAFAYKTGWRIRSEVLPMQWRQIDFSAREARLDAGTTKNKAPRTIKLSGELLRLLEEQLSHTRAVERRRGMVCPWVFHRGGKRIMDFYGAWRSACTKAGCPDRIPHDLRRTAVRNMVRAGIPQRVAMRITGHKTDHVFGRYDIVSDTDLEDAAQRLDDLGAKRIEATETNQRP